MRDPEREAIENKLFEQADARLDVAACYGNESLTDEQWNEATANLNSYYGEGFADKHPELVIAFMRVLAYNTRTALLAQGVK